MKKSRCTKEQIAFLLKQAKLCTPTACVMVDTVPAECVSKKRTCQALSCLMNLYCLKWT